MEGSGTSSILKCVWVKAEPSLPSGARGRHAGHERNHNEAREPAAHSYIDVFVKQEVLSVKQEAQSEEEDECATQETLYAGHKLKSELVPEGPQLPDAAFTPCVRVKVECEGGEEGRGALPPARTQLGNIKVTAGDNYVCPVCRETFALKSHLTEHVVAHDRTARRRKPHADSGAVAVKVKRVKEEREGEGEGRGGGGEQLALRDCEHVVVHIHTPTSPEQGESALMSGARASSCGQRPPAPPAPPHTHAHRTHTPTLAPTDSETPHSCDICQKQFKKSYHLKEHRQIHTGDKPYSCEICKKQFTKSGNLNKHRRIHTGEKPYSCEICKKQFTESSHLNAHRRIHTSDKPYSCEICNKQFRNSSHLKAHIQTHSGDRPFSCEICKKQFKKSRHLKEHRWIHTGDKPYACEICEKKFTTLGNLNTHRRIHTVNKSFSCGICKKRFTRSSVLNRHRRIHTGEKPFSCEICKKQFTISSVLKIHRRIHTGEKPYACDLCEKQFSQKGDLVKHMRRHARKANERPSPVEHRPAAPV